MPVGVHVGTFVHRVLEAADFAADDLDEELARCVASERARRAVDIGEPAAVVAGLRAAIETPLGPVFGGGVRLRDLARVDRLDELDFELPLVGEMHRAHYALQALLYTAALHRFLRWRVEGYDPEVHLAGVAYLFLRGMTGADTPQVDGSPCGVFSWCPPGALVTALSDVLDRGGAA
jgi:ATP-dependent exoDNAse (exonuclease V) beta subunit